MVLIPRVRKIISTCTILYNGDTGLDGAKHVNDTSKHIAASVPFRKTCITGTFLCMCGMKEKEENSFTDLLSSSEIS